MRYLIAFLWKHSFFFLFVFLECIAFLLMINSQNYQGTVIINSTNQFTGTLNTIYTNITDYFSLRKSNQQLLEENTKLHNLILTYQNDSIPIMHDTTYEYIGARVISNSVHHRNNYIRLNKGSNDGVEIDMGVVSDKGIVGIVIGVSKNFSTVMSLLHKDSKVSAKIKKNNQLANIVWEKIDYQRGKLDHIPTHLLLLQGDTIITSGNSLIFPEGINIGFVEHYFQNEGENLNSASILFATDFNALHHVYIIKNKQKKEIQELINEVENE